MGFYRSLRHKAETWNSFSKSDRGLLISACFLLPIVAASLKTVGLQRTQSWLAGNALAPMLPATDRRERMSGAQPKWLQRLTGCIRAQQLPSSHRCTLELVTTPGHRS